MISVVDFSRLKSIVDENLIGFLPEMDSNSSPLYESMIYTLTGDGKRLRPVLLLLACEFVGGDVKQAIPYACAVEYIHNYSLIHDDLPSMDDDDLRRGEPTNHKVFGEAVAILAGDGLLSSAFELMNRDCLLYFDKPDLLKRRIRAIAEILKASGCRGMIAGQVADIDAGNKVISHELLDYIHLNKTSALISASIVAGAYLGNANQDVIIKMRIYGENLGLAFQIVDDILDMVGEKDVMGKTTGQDDIANMPSYPLTHGLEKSYERLDELTEKAIEAISDCNVEESMINNFIEIAKSLAKRTK